MRNCFARAALFVLVAGCLLSGLSACLPVPLGDAEKAKADPQFIGVWEWKDGDINKAALIRAWDERTYVIDIVGFTGAAESVRPRERNVYKGWLAEVKGHTFLNLQPMESLSALAGQKREVAYVVLKLLLAGETLTATPLDYEFQPFKDVGTSTALEKIVAENLDDVKMWLKPITAAKCSAARGEELDRILKMFQMMGE